MKKSRYEKLLEKLNMFISKAERDPEAWQRACDSMIHYLEALDIPGREHNLRIIHVAGTKGKGSTCAMVESILRASGYRTGLLTSPHLCDVRERIRINGRMVSMDTFTKYGEHCLRRMYKLEDFGVDLPGFFRYMTLLAFTIFLTNKLDVVVVEVGIGGRFDSTNFIRNPVVCGITMIDYDHMELLGNTLEEIASEKAGIMKEGRPVITYRQCEEVEKTLIACAKEKDCDLDFVDVNKEFKNGNLIFNFSLNSEYQKKNAHLAIAIAKCFERNFDQYETKLLTRVSVKHRNERLNDLNNGILPLSYIRGLKSFSWPGRAQILREYDVLGDTEYKFRKLSKAVGDMPIYAGGTLRRDYPHNLTYFLDGAHTIESIKEASSWFISHNDTPLSLANKKLNLLLFTITGKRDSYAMLKSLIETFRKSNLKINKAMFTKPDSLKTELVRTDRTIDTSLQEKLLNNWCELNGKDVDVEDVEIERELELPEYHKEDDGRVSILAPEIMPNIAGSLHWIRNFAKDNSRFDIRVLITGSLFLVGDVLKYLRKAPK